jgi:hypothetical protein
MDETRKRMSQFDANFIKLHHLATKRTLITYIIKVSFALTAVVSSLQVALLKI